MRISKHCGWIILVLAATVSAQAPPGPELVLDGSPLLAAGVPVRVAIDFESHGYAITAVAFSLDVDLDRLGFDPADADEDGVPDAANFPFGSPSLTFVRFDAGDPDGELDVLLADLSGQPLIDGLRLEIELLPTAGGRVAEFIRFSQAPPASFGNAQGEDVPGTTVVTTEDPEEPSACQPGPERACLLDGRFEVVGTMKDFGSPPREFANRVMGFPDPRAESDQAVFFHSFNPGNFEVGVKMVDGCSLPADDPLRAFWAFFGGLTNAGTDIEIEDTATGQVVEWRNPAGEFPLTLGDVGAFPCTEGTPAAPCLRDDTTACLLDGRFRVTGTMQDFSDPPAEFPVTVMDFPGGRAESTQAVFFESFNSGNFEIGVKMVDGCGLDPGHPLRFYWVFYGGLTNAETEVRVTQIASGRVDVWHNPSGVFPLTEGRTQAFSCE